MPKKAQFDLSQKPNGKWKVNLAPTVSPSGRRTAKVFDTKTKAENWIAQRRRYIDRHGAEEISLTKQQMVDARKALNLLEKTELRQRHTLSLARAAEYYLEHLKHEDEAHTFEEVYDFSRNSRNNKAGVGWSAPHIDDNDRMMLGPKIVQGKMPYKRDESRGFFNRFGTTHIDKIESKDIQQWLNKCQSSSADNYNKALTILNPVFSYALKEDWIRKNPLANIKKLKSKRHKSILKMAQAERAIELIQTPKYECISAGVAILMFGGVRYSEFIGRPKKDDSMQWDQIDFDESMLKVVGRAGAKEETGRQVDMMPVLRAWLENIPESERSDSIMGVSWVRKYAAFRNDLGLTEKDSNIFRHSFATYHSKHSKNYKNTIYQMGHTGETNTFRTHYYHNNVESGSPEKYWSLFPENYTGSKIVKPSFKSVAN